jgi:hypothetical protein
MISIQVVPARGVDAYQLLSLAMLPFPHPAHRTGRADLPHPALGEDSRNR